MPGLLLKYVPYINLCGEPDGINSAIGIAPVILDQFKNARSAKPFKRLRFRWFLTTLGRVKRIAKNALNRARQSLHVLSA